MKPMGFQAQLIYLIAWILRVPKNSISPNTHLRNDLYLDTTDINLMMFKLENYYKTEFSTEQIEAVSTVQDIGKLLRQ